MTQNRFSVIALAILTLFSVALRAEVKLPTIIGNGMVLQRDSEIRLWGWANPGENIAVSFLEKDYRAKADSNGDWHVELDSAPAGGPYRLTIEGDNKIELEDVLLGDVWICSGQSNMTHYFGRHQERYAKEIAEADQPRIRQFYVPTNPVLSGPLEDVPNLKWSTANPESVLDFTVVGYFFAKSLHDRYDVPIGIINTAVGGTRIESWTSEEGFSDYPEITATITRNKDAAYVESVNAEAKKDRESDGPKRTFDKGMAGESKWYEPAHQPLNWKPINIPGYWEHQGVRDLNGVVWYRREIEIPASMTGLPVEVKLGRIRNADKFYVNGEFVGQTTYEYPQREYTIPADLLKPGKNLFVIRVENGWGNGGFIPDKPYHLEAAGQRIDLKGEWQYKVGEAYRPQRSYKNGINAQNEPSSLYNGMIAPFKTYPISGYIWYQGESNAGDPDAYRQLLPNLISDWRSQWQQGELPFLIAQLPNFMDVDYLPAESGWAQMREAQMDASRALEKVGTSINIELGEWNDIHPGNKKPVGERLALKAMEIAYGDEDLVSSGPVFESQVIVGNEIVLNFNYVGEGLTSNNGEPLAHFAIAGEDKRFVWAEARIEGDTVVVKSEEIPNPLYVRYAWADNPDFANLANKDGLPAAPFRTDR